MSWLGWNKHVEATAFTVEQDPIDPECFRGFTTSVGLGASHLPALCKCKRRVAAPNTKASRSLSSVLLLVTQFPDCCF